MMPFLLLLFYFLKDNDYFVWFLVYQSSLQFMYIIDEFLDMYLCKMCKNIRVDMFNAMISHLS